ncbi:MAG: hypothetical protein LBQ16_04100 [Gracilibacteraceae bacterium]|jgi:prophage antirepressor-like protein|nr:hypothetical protein [Gracilibacteraceae bacterium]
MADSTVSALAIFDKGKELNYLEKNGEILFTAEEIGKHLGYREPAISISTLFSRNQNELKLYSSVIKVINEEGYQRDTRVFTEEGVYIISMLARTNNAKQFRARVALLLRRIRQETMQAALENARRAALTAGAQTVYSLTPRKKKLMSYAVRYRKMGLGVHSIGKLMDCHGREVSSLLKAAVALGKLPAGHKAAPMSSSTEARHDQLPA